ncbi:MAG: IS6 family transposase [Nitrososphaera sp.]
MEYGKEANKLCTKQTRSEKAYKIVFQEGAISRLDEHTYQVRSQSGNGSYVVVSTEFGWKCSCADHQYRRVTCKHIIAITYSQHLRREVQEAAKTVIAAVDTLACKFCKSIKVVKDSLRHNKYGNIQRYLCKVCRKTFSFNIGFEGMRASPQIITTAMQLYFSGESLRNVQRFVKLQGLQISHVTIYKWIGKYVKLMQDYLEKITPQVSDTWRTDELFLKIKGDTKYLYALMDDETRFWIAQQVADSKFTQDVRPLFKKGKEVAGKKPMTLISDGAFNFQEAYQRELYSHTLPRTRHIRHIHLEGDHNNNKMERLNGEIRDREKVMRGLKRMDTPILTGYQMYHNYFREHEGLVGKTPAEVAGIKIEGKNKWMTVIQNATILSRGKIVS